MKLSIALLAASALTGIFLCDSFAIDLNGNGLSDVWETRYRYDAAYPPFADTDGDGDTSIRESEFGTDPRTPNSRHPSVTVLTATPNLTASFPSVPGIRYQTDGSADLIAPWQGVGGPIVGTGGVLQTTVNGPFSGRYFLRLRTLLALDGDNDGLTTYEETLLGTSDTTGLSDADALTDLEEFRLQFLYGIASDPTKEFTVAGVRDGTRDSDGDGINDLLELRAGTDPSKAKSSPPGNPNADNDQDGLKDAMEVQWFGNITSQSGSGNPDNDRLNNREEQLLNLNPTLFMTNGTREDGLSDQDGDNVIDAWELEDGTDPLLASSVDVATNFVVLQGSLEHKDSWGTVCSPANQFSGVTLRAQAVGYETAQLSTGSQTYGLKNDLVGPLPAVTGQPGNYLITRPMRFRKGVRYKVELLNPNNVVQMPFVSGKYVWVSSGNADEPSYTYFNYEVVGRRWYHRDPNDTVSPIGTVPTDPTITPNPDVSNTHFTQKGPGFLGSPDPILYPTGFLTLKPIQVVTAEGPNAGRPMKFISTYTPSDGVGKRLPIYNSPSVDLQLSSVTAGTMSVQFLGISYSLTVDTTDARLYKHASGLTIRLFAPPLADPNVLEYLNAMVNLPAEGISAAFYVCEETAAGSSIFQNEGHGVIATLTGLDAGTVDTLSATFYEPGFTTDDVALVETSPASRTFFGQGITALVLNTSVGGPLLIAVTSPAPGLSNTVLKLVNIGGAFRNFAPKIVTNHPPSTPVGAGFRIRTLARLGGPTNTPPTRFRIKPSAGGGAAGPWTEVPMAETATPGVFESTDKLVLVSEGSPSVPDHRTIPVNLAQFDFAAPEEEIEVDNGPAFHSNKGQAEAVVLQSLENKSKRGQNLAPDKEIAAPLEAFGYKVFFDGDAKTNDALNVYAPGKQVWYSMCHGAVPGGIIPFDYIIGGVFAGLAFTDHKTNGLIDTERLTAKNLNYRFVMASACASAQTSEESVDGAMDTDFLLTGVREFGEAWGSKAAYVGYGWSVHPLDAENKMASFLGTFRKIAPSNVGRNVNQALAAFRRGNPRADKRLLLKLQVNGGTGDEPRYIIDRTASNAK